MDTSHQLMDFWGTLKIQPIAMTYQKLLSPNPGSLPSYPVSSFYGFLLWILCPFPVAKSEYL
jgi:hypothetical protein